MIIKYFRTQDNKLPEWFSVIRKTFHKLEIFNVDKGEGLNEANYYGLKSFPVLVLENNYGTLLGIWTHDFNEIYEMFFREEGADGD